MGGEAEWLPFLGFIFTKDEIGSPKFRGAELFRLVRDFRTALDEDISLGETVKTWIERRTLHGRHGRGARK